MDETMKNTANETAEDVKEEVAATEENTSEDPLKEAIETQMRKIQRQSMLIGAQTICKVILDKIIATEGKASKTTMNDYKRLIKDIKSFCLTGLSRQVNAEGETEPVEESNENNTKLMENTDD